MAKEVTMRIKFFIPASRRSLKDVRRNAPIAAAEASISINMWRKM